jgi:hypothetical protein
MWKWKGRQIREKAERWLQTNLRINTIEIENHQPVTENLILPRSYEIITEGHQLFKPNPNTINYNKILFLKFLEELKPILNSLISLLITILSALIKYLFNEVLLVYSFSSQPSPSLYLCKMSSFFYYIFFYVIVFYINYLYFL